MDFTTSRRRGYIEFGFKWKRVCGMMIMKCILHSAIRNCIIFSWHGEKTKTKKLIDAGCWCCLPPSSSARRSSQMNNKIISFACICFRLRLLDCAHTHIILPPHPPEDVKPTHTPDIRLTCANELLNECNCTSFHLMTNRFSHLRMHFCSANAFADGPTWLHHTFACAALWFCTQHTHTNACSVTTKRWIIPPPPPSIYGMRCQHTNTQMRTFKNRRNQHVARTKWSKFHAEVAHEMFTKLVYLVDIYISHSND